MLSNIGCQPSATKRPPFTDLTLLTLPLPTATSFTERIRSVESSYVMEPAVTSVTIPRMTAGISLLLDMKPIRILPPNLLSVAAWKSISESKSHRKLILTHKCFCN